MLSHRQLTWRRFSRHRLGRLALDLLVYFYFVALLAEFFAPHPASVRDVDRIFCPPQLPRYSPTHGWYAQAMVREMDPVTLRQSYAPRDDAVIPLGFFVRGEPNRLWNIIALERRFFSVDRARFAALPGNTSATPVPVVHFLGADKYGRDILSRVIAGSRLGLYIGLVAIAITIVLSLLGWMQLAQVVRGRILSLRDEDFVTAARLLGARHSRVLLRHLLPGLLSHIIVMVTLTIPGMILCETALSFLGLGLRPPVVSWGVMLQDCMNVQVVADYPWMLTPVLAIIITVVSFNDMFPTIMEIAAVQYHPDYYDGLTLGPILRGEDDNLERSALFWHYPHYHHQGGVPASAVRAGKYKLIEWHEQRLLGTGPAVSLFDLETDLGETHDLAGELPEVVRDLRNRLHAWRASVRAQEMTVRR